MIKKLFLSVVALVLGCVAYAQVENPVQWSAKVENLGENLYEIVLTGTIEGEEWHIYDLGPYTDGPIATSLVVAGEGVKAVGSPYLKTEVHRAYDELFGMEIGTCATGVQIGQKVEVSGSAPVAKVTVEWQTCSEGSCLPPTDDVLTVKLPAGTGAAASADEVAPVKKEGGKSIWAVILEAIAWGFVALLTPCVFPMVPMTVSFFLKSKDGKGKFYASMYGFFIVALYTLPIAVIILLTYILGGDAVTADIFNWLATHWIPNILFFIIFMVFAASFFGAFEITMPSWMVNKTDAKSDKGGLVGVFFMALTLVLVSFSCTGPIMSSVLIKSTQGDIWEPIITMFAIGGILVIGFMYGRLLESIIAAALILLISIHESD